MRFLLVAIVFSLMFLLFNAAGGYAQDLFIRQHTVPDEQTKSESSPEVPTLYLKGDGPYIRSRDMPEIKQKKRTTPLILSETDSKKTALPSGWGNIGKMGLKIRLAEHQEALRKAEKRRKLAAKKISEYREQKEARDALKRKQQDAVIKASQKTVEVPKEKIQPGQTPSVDSQSDLPTLFNSSF